MTVFSALTCLSTCQRRPAVQHLAVPVNKKSNLVGKPNDHGEQGAGVQAHLRNDNIVALGHFFRKKKKVTISNGEFIQQKFPPKCFDTQ